MNKRVTIKRINIKSTTYVKTIEKASATVTESYKTIKTEHVNI